MADSRPTPSESALSLHLYGSNVTDETIHQAGDAMIGLLEALNESVLGDKDAVRWTLGPVRYICDGCDTERPTAALPLGWVNGPGGMDYCPSCLHGGER